MEGEAVRDAGWPDTGKSDLHKGRTGAIAFPLAESLECGRPPSRRIICPTAGTCHARAQNAVRHSPIIGPTLKCLYSGRVSAQI